MRLWGFIAMSTAVRQSSKAHRPDKNMCAENETQLVQNHEKGWKVPDEPEERTVAETLQLGLRETTV